MMMTSREVTSLGCCYDTFKWMASLSICTRRCFGPRLQALYIHLSEFVCTSEWELAANWHKPAKLDHLRSKRVSPTKLLPPANKT